MAEKAEYLPMQGVVSRPGDDVHYAAGGASELRRVVAAVDLELLHGSLRDGRPHSPGVVDVRNPVNADEVPATITARKGKARVRRLADAKVRVVHYSVGIGDARGQQREVQEVAPVDGKLSDALLLNRVCLLGFFGLYRWRHGDHLDGGGHDAGRETKVYSDGLPNGEGYPRNHLARKADGLHLGRVSSGSE